MPNRELLLSLAMLLLTPSIDFAQMSRLESRAAAPVDIPFRLCNGNLVVVNATIGAIRNVNMILDTGTNPSAISKEIASRLKRTGGSESLETLNGTIQTQSLTLDEIQLGSLRIASLHVLVHDFAKMESSLGTSISGILGLDVLGAGPFTIDYEKRTVTFGSAIALRNSVPLASIEPFPIVLTTVNGQQVRLLLDSGTWGLLIFRGRLRITPHQVHLDRTSSVISTGGSAQLSWLRTDISLGQADLGIHKIAIAAADADPELDGLLGFAGMGFHRVAVDLEKRVFSWE